MTETNTLINSATGNKLSIWPDAIPAESIPEYPSYDFLKASSEGDATQLTWEIDPTIDIGVLVRQRPAKPGELIRNADLRYELDWAENILFRANILKHAETSPEYRALQWQLCKSSILYYINTFCWTFDPRRIADGNKPDIPFVTFPFQDDLLTWAVWLLHIRDSGLIEKSREMGATWCFMALASWMCNFYPGTVIYPSSLREEDVDNRTEDSLFGKFRYIQRNLPEWLRSGWKEEALRTDSKNLIILPTTGSVMRGQKTESTGGRQGRATCFIPDEFAHIGDAKAVLAAFASLSPTVFYISTPKGMGNEFARMAHDPAVKKKTLHWSEHPQKTKDWHKKESAKPANTPEIMAQEHEIQYETSTSGRVFPKFRSFPDPENENIWVHIQDGTLVEYDPVYNVITGIDFGINDPTSILYAQIKPAPVQYHRWTKKTLVFFAEKEETDLNALEWRYIINHTGYRYDLHVGDMRTGKQRDPMGKHWVKYLKGEITQTEHSEYLGLTITQAEKPVVVKGRYNTEMEPITKFREMLAVPGGVAFSRYGIPHFIMAMQNWAFPVSKETGRPIPGSSPDHSEWSHACKAGCYLMDWLFGNAKKTDDDNRKPEDWLFPTSKVSKL